MKWPSFKSSLSSTVGLEKIFPTESDFMAGKCSFKGKQSEVSSQMQKRNLNQEKFSTSVANAPTLYPLIVPMDVSLSSWIHKKHEKELLTAHLLKRDEKITLSMLCVIFDGGLVDAGDFWGAEKCCGIFFSVEEGGPFCQSSLKFLFACLC